MFCYVVERLRNRRMKKSDTLISLVVTGVIIAVLSAGIIVLAVMAYRLIEG